MKRAFLLLSVSVLLISASPYKGITAERKQTVEQALANVSEERANEFLKALKETKPNQREGMAFLISYMPKKDLKNLSLDILKEAVNYGYKVREEFSWCKELPEEIFFNDVLPYASMDETRELWREEFYNLFKPLVVNCKNAREVIDTVNKSIEKLVGVSYNTRRKKPNQSPHESMEIHMASCSGLSILLTDALRSVGIPSRIGGTPMWVTREGNHNWCEVWIDGQWYFTEYTPDKLDHSWFLVRAAAADTTDNPIYQVYVTSFKPTANNQHFIMVWNWRDRSVPGEIVTKRYVEVYKKQQSEVAIQKGWIPVIIKAYKKDGQMNNSSDRVAVDVKIFGNKESKRPIASGRTANATADMNNYLTVYLPANKSFKIVYKDKCENIETTDTQKEVVLRVE